MTVSRRAGWVVAVCALALAAGSVLLLRLHVPAPPSAPRAPHDPRLARLHEGSAQIPLGGGASGSGGAEAASRRDKREDFLDVRIHNGSANPFTRPGEALAPPAPSEDAPQAPAEPEERAPYRAVWRQGLHGAALRDDGACVVPHVDAADVKGAAALAGYRCVGPSAVRLRVEPPAADGGWAASNATATTVALRCPEGSAGGDLRVVLQDAPGAAEKAVPEWRRAEPLPKGAGPPDAAGGVVLDGRDGFVRARCDGTGDRAAAVVLSPRPRFVRRAQRLRQQRAGAHREPLDVLVLLLDSMARAQMHRALPATMRWLEAEGAARAQRRAAAAQGAARGDAPATLAFEMLKYGIVGSATPPNLFALLSGHPFPDGQAFFEGHPFAGVNVSGSSRGFHGYRSRWGPQECLAAPCSRITRGACPADASPWLWDVLPRRAGYVTMRATASCGEEDDFHYPDYIQRPWADHVLTGRLSCDAGVRGLFQAAPECIGDRLAHDFAFDFAARFWEAYVPARAPAFGVVHLDEAHEPSLRRGATLDDSVVGALEGLRARGLLRRTAVLVMSDHGIGYGTHRGQPGGALEERLPGLLLLAPEELVDAELEALRGNAQRLATPFDVYATILDLAGVRGDDAHGPWARSLLEPLPDARGCREAGINADACACAHWDGARREWSAVCGDETLRRARGCEPTQHT